MGSFVDFFESIEKLAYKVLLWIILIPKTFLRIIIEPTWAPGYIKSELAKEKSQFDFYVSPVILFLAVALIPALIIFILPELGVTIASPAESNPSTERVVEFDAETTFISASDQMRDEYSWYVERGTSDNDGNYQYSEIYRETYSEIDQSTTITDVENRYDGQPLTFLYPDQAYNSSKGVFFFAFEPGDYYVNVQVKRADTNNTAVPLEEYYSYVNVYVPENPEDLVEVSNGNGPYPETEGSKLSREDFAEQFSKERTVFLALLLMIPPLLFALATKVFTTEEIGENTLRENFYVQCYYFSPPSLAIWATFYGVLYYTKDIFFYNEAYVFVVLLPYALAFIWFLSAETLAIAESRRVSIWKSFLLVVFCISIIFSGILVWAFIVTLDLQDNLRKLGILAYPVLAIVILLVFSTTRLKGWLVERKKFSLHDAIHIGAFLFTIMVFGICYLLSMLAYPSTQALAAQPTSISVTAKAPANTMVFESPTPLATIPVVLEFPTPTGNPSTYQLQTGEFPYCIARRFNVDPRQLLALNGLLEGEMLGAGTILNIPQNGKPFPGNRSLHNHPTTYEVASLNETAHTVACYFGDIDPGKIAQTNGISIADTLPVGQKLEIP